MISLKECLSLIRDSIHEKDRIKGIKLLSGVVDKDDLFAILQPLIEEENSQAVRMTAIVEVANAFRGDCNDRPKRLLAKLICDPSLQIMVRKVAYFSFLKMLDSRSTKGFRSVEEMNLSVNRVLKQISSIYEFNPETDIDWKLVKQYFCR